MKILLVDDEKIERDGIKFLIKKYQLPLVVEEANNGKKAWEYIEKHNDVDILLTDVKMPYMDGLELAQKVNDFNSNIVIIIFSAYSEFDYAKRACQVNAVNYLLKPIEIEEFCSVINRVMQICDRRKQQEILKASDKKLWLYRLINTKDAVSEISDILQSKYDINLENKNMCFISVETRDNFFEQKEDEFEEILRNNIGQNFETINLYPNLSYVLLYSSETIEMEEIESSIRKIYSRLSFDKKEKFSIIVGTKFYGMRNFRSKLEELEKILKDTFSYFSGIIYTSKTNIKSAGILEEQFQLKESVMKSIKDKNIAAIEEQLLIYLKMLEDEKSSSAFFAKYLIVDIVKAIYQEFGTYNENMILNTANEIMSSNDLKRVGEILIKVLEEIGEMDREILPDTSLTIKEIKKIVKNEYMNDIGLDEIAEKVCLTSSTTIYLWLIPLTASKELPI